MRRVKDLIDVWFDSGAMPFAQWHYPFENKDRFESQFPADYICEAVDQTRGWFYSLHAISTLLVDSVAYKNVICLGLILDATQEDVQALAILWIRDVLAATVPTHSVYLYSIAPRKAVSMTLWAK
jgi:hypothetical protein